jgi:hypothetical protein
MRRFIVTIVVALTVGLATGPALASQCPTLIKKIEEETGTRFDQAAADARAKAAEAAELHAQGKHVESEAAARQGLKLLGM